MIEVIAAGAILGALLVVCAQMLSRTAVQQQAIANRRAALQMASNAMERARSVPWDELGAANTEQIAQAVADQGMLRGGRVDVTVDEPESSPPARRIRVTVSWKEERDGEDRTQELTAWRFADVLPERKNAARAESASRAKDKQ